MSSARINVLYPRILTPRATAPTMLSFLKKKTSPDAAPASDPASAEPARAGWLARLKGSLKRTGSQLGGLFGRGKIDEALYEDLESVLLSADAGVEATQFLLERMRSRARKEGLAEAAELKQVLGEELLALLAPLEKPATISAKRPWVVMMVGVNGAGKTTSIGKLAHHYQQAGHTLLLAAGDTFRAAAREQLAAWGERNDVTVISQQGGDASAVMFDAISAGRARGSDIVLADTAGRLPTQAHLMEELKKVKRVIAKAEPGAPHEIWLVIDGNTGQNAVAQVKAFDEALGLTGLIVTKLDGTAKGGVLAAIALTRSKNLRQQPIPLRFIGVGEGLDDLRPFVAEDFVNALLD
jgi:fused signal recognition particle receptor